MIPGGNPLRDRIRGSSGITKSRTPCDSLSVDCVSAVPEDMASTINHKRKNTTMDETITLTLPRLFVAQIILTMREVEFALSSRQSYVWGGSLTAKEAFKLIKYYLEIIDTVEQQFSNNQAPPD